VDARVPLSFRVESCRRAFRDEFFRAISQTAIFYKEPLRMGNHPDDASRTSRKQTPVRDSSFRVPEIARRFFPGARLRVFCHVRVEISHRESRT